MQTMSTVPGRTRFMVMLLLLWAGLAGAQTNHWQTEGWLRLDSLERAGLPRSAMVEAQGLYVKAREQKDQAQLVHAAICMLKYSMATDSSPVQHNLLQIEQEIRRAPFPARQIFHCLAAAHCLVVLQRTIAEEDGEGDDMATAPMNWAEQKLYGLVNSHLVSGLRPLDALARVPAERFGSILVHTPKHLALTPSLADVLLGQAAVVYEELMEGEFDQDFAWLEDDLEFPLYNAGLYGDAAKFMSLRPRDLNLRTAGAKGLLLVHQKQLELHLNDGDPTALVHAELQRGKYVNALLGHVGGWGGMDSDERDSLQVGHLLELFHTYEGHASSGYVLDQLSLYHEDSDWIGKLSGSDMGTKAWLLGALEGMIARFPGGMFDDVCRVDRSRLLMGRYNLEFPHVGYPGAPMLALLGHQNLDSVRMRVVQLPLDAPDIHDSLFMAWVESRGDFWRKSVRLPNWTDLELHRTIIAIDTALDAGRYAVAVEPLGAVHLLDGSPRWQEFHVSRMACVFTKAGPDVHYLRVLDQNTGEPIAGAQLEAEVSMKLMGRQLSRRVQLGLVSDQEGLIQVPFLPRFWTHHFNWRVRLGSKDVKRVNGFPHHWEYQQGQSAIPKALVLTDRRHYRPGQVVQWKAIAYTWKPTGPVPVAKDTVAVSLCALGGNILQEVKVKTDAMGSCTGSFMLPERINTGRYRLECHGGNTFIEVEEYKRDQLEMVAGLSSTDLHLGDSVAIEGRVETLFGGGVGGLQVEGYVELRTGWGKWEVYDDMGARRSHDRDSSFELGGIRTDTTGKFVVRFRLPRGRSLPDVVETGMGRAFLGCQDGSGRRVTRSLEWRFGRAPLELQVGFPREVGPERIAQLDLKAKDQNGGQVAVGGRLRVWRLVPVLSGGLRVAPFDEADSSLVPLERLQRDFSHYGLGHGKSVADWVDIFPPYQPYLDAEQVEQFDWERGGLVLEMKVEESLKGKRLREVEALESGRYAIEVEVGSSSGDSGHWEMEYVRLGEADSLPPYPTAMWMDLPTVEAKPGGELEVRIGTYLPHATVLLGCVVGHTAVHRVVEVTRGMNVVHFELPKGIIGKGAVDAMMVYKGQAATCRQLFEVKLPAERLQLTLTRFRSRMVPGAMEEWRIRVRDAEGRPVAGQVVATLYDAALDAWGRHDWMRGMKEIEWLDGYANESISMEEMRRRTSWDNFRHVSDTIEDEGIVVAELQLFGYDFWNMHLDRGTGGAAAWRILGGIPTDPSKQTGQILEGHRSVLPARRGTRSVYAADIEGADFGLYTFGSGIDEMGGEASLPMLRIDPLRRHHGETGFFLPMLQTDTNGEVELRFRVPEALSRWRLMALAHNGNLDFGLLDTICTTFKPLSIQANVPRFLREGDEMELTASVTNYSDDSVRGKAWIELVELSSGNLVTDKLLLDGADRRIELDAEGRASVGWRVKVLGGMGKVAYRVHVEVPGHRDGEEHLLNILPNVVHGRHVVDLQVPPGKEGEWEVLPGEWRVGGGIKPLGMRVDLASPGGKWSLLEALPYLVEYPHECSEQSLGRLFASRVAGSLLAKDNELASQLEDWRAALGQGSHAVEVGSEVGWEETPWLMERVLAVGRERELCAALTPERLSASSQSAEDRLLALMDYSGIGWYAAEDVNTLITGHVLAGLGQMDRLGLLGISEADARDNSLVLPLLRGVYGALEDAAREIGKSGAPKSEVGSEVIQCLYAWSYWRGVEVVTADVSAVAVVSKAALANFGELGAMSRAQLALALHRQGDRAGTEAIVRSLKEFAVSTQRGTYIRNGQTGGWWGSDVETQATVMEVLLEIEGRSVLTDGLARWLLSQRGVESWGSTKATMLAVYALLLGDAPDGGAAGDAPKVWLEGGDLAFRQVRPGRYSSWVPGAELQAGKGKLVVKAGDPEHIFQGHAVVDYLQPMGQLAVKGKRLVLERLISVQRMEGGRPRLVPLKAGERLSPGELLEVSLVLTAGEDLQYVHLLDHHPAGMESTKPHTREESLDKGGGYTVSPRGAGTHFFIASLPKGRHVVKHQLVVSYAGRFQAGHATAECMYSPDISACSGAGGWIVVR